MPKVPVPKPKPTTRPQTKHHTSKSAPAPKQDPIYAPGIDPKDHKRNPVFQRHDYHHPVFGGCDGCGRLKCADPKPHNEPCDHQCRLPGMGFTPHPNSYVDRRNWLDCPWEDRYIHGKRRWVKGEKCTPPDNTTCKCCSLPVVKGGENGRGKKNMACWMKYHPGRS